MNIEDLATKAGRAVAVPSSANSTITLNVNGAAKQLGSAVDNIT